MKIFVVFSHGPGLRPVRDQQLVVSIQSLRSVGTSLRLMIDRVIRRPADVDLMPFRTIYAHVGHFLHGGSYLFNGHVITESGELAHVAGIIYFRNDDFDPSLC